MKLFGTDGIRGRAGNFPMDVQTAVRLGIATGKTMRENDMSRQVVLGRDTRESSTFLEAAISSGLMSEGVGILNVGVVPKPAAAQLTKHFSADIGIYIMTCSPESPHL